MNGFQRIRAAVRGEWPDCTPVMLHNFPIAAREAGLAMAEFRSDPAAIARAFIESIEKYGYDGIVLDVDTATLAGAVGVPVDFPEDLPARSHTGNLSHLAGVDTLAPIDIDAYSGIQIWLEAATRLKEHFKDEVFLRGNCDQCPFSLAAAMRSIDAWMLDLADPANEDYIHRLLEYCTEATIGFVRRMAAAGVHMVSNGDSVAGSGLVSPRLYRKFALPYEQRLVCAAHELALPYVLHICGKTDLILDDMISTGADGLELDHLTDARAAHDKMKHTTVFLGNLDPSGVVALGSEGDVEAAARALLGLFSDTPRFILNAGCAIPATTPPANVRAIVRVAHANDLSGEAR